MPPPKGNPTGPSQASSRVTPPAGGSRSESPTTPRPVRVTSDLAHAAARRIVSQAGGDLDAAARRLLASAPQHGIDFSLAFATLEPGPAPVGKGARAAHAIHVRQACLPVLGPGRTAMIFLSEPAPWEADTELATAERAACLVATCEHLARLPDGRVKIAQALPELEETWFERALERAGFISVGTLSYMRQEPVALMRGKRPTLPELPPGVTVRWLSDPAPPTPPASAPRAAQDQSSQPDAPLLAALDASYANTLDCPELCGLRDTADILASHKSTGTFDPSLWLLVMLDGVPSGCVLLSRCPEQRTIELVYLGLGQSLRGKGLGRTLLPYCMARARSVVPGWPVTCAVDERNVPALRLYERLGFTVFGRRRALVRPV